MQFTHTQHGLANHLVTHGLLTPTIAENAIHSSHHEGITLVSYLVKKKILTSEFIKTSCQNAFGLNSFSIKNYDAAWLHNSPLTRALILQYRVIPLKKSHSTLEIGLSDPTDRHTIDAITFHTGYHIVPVIMDENEIDDFIQTYCVDTDTSKSMQLQLLNEIPIETNLHHEPDNTYHDEPLIKLVDTILNDAIQKRASDIHIEPYEESCRIRYRLHGILHEINKIPTSLAHRLSARLKIMAQLDISERRLPQDGRLQIQDIDIRINSCPTHFGEKIVLRLLNTSNVSLDIATLGFTHNQHALFLKKISQPHGMILVTGPTGCGKTVTLYSALHHLNVPEKNISTIENPIEIRLPGINQVNINSKIGLNFSTVLRALLRQDPDIIMVGEIRDHDTAVMAAQAAQTGHLVLSTLHTNSANDALSRLHSLGVDPYTISNSMILILSQRLIRVLCNHCKQPENAPQDAFFSKHQVTTLYRPLGCPHCLNGYTSRTAIYELMPFPYTPNEITGSLKQINHLTLKDAAMIKVMKGITSIDEINRVITSCD